MFGSLCVEFKEKYDNSMEANKLFIFIIDTSFKTANNKDHSLENKKKTVLNLKF